MIVCKKCGNQNPDDATFCTSCRAFLEWSGEKVVEAPPPAPPPPPAPEPETHFVDRVKQAVGLEQPRAEPAPPPPAPAPPAGAPATPAVQATPAAPPVGRETPVVAAVPAPAAAAAAAAAPAVAPRAPEIPIARAPQAVAPAPERPRQQHKIDTATGQRYKPGDVICGQCGAGNGPERHFCQRCGANLAAAVVVKTPWYRKLFRARGAPVAGTRPKGAPVERAWGAALFRVIGLGVIVAVVLGYLVIPPLHSRVNTAVSDAYTAARCRFAPKACMFYVEPSQATASSQLSIHPARLTVDLIKETYWATNMATDKQPWLRFTFGAPVDFDQLLFTSGAANDYATMARPKEVLISMSDKSSRHITLKDDRDAITYDLPGRQITWVEIQILSVYPTAQSTDVAINEVEFLRIK